MKRVKRAKRPVYGLVALFSALALLAAACGGSEGPGAEETGGEQEPTAETPDDATAEPTAGEAGSGFYDGDNITLLIPYGPGGGTDTFVRSVIPFLEEHVPGNVTFTIDNVPGAGSVEGANEFFNERPSDGYTFMVGSASTTMNWLLETPGVNFDYREMQPLMAWSANAVQYVRADTGIESWEDMAAYDGQLTYAGISPTGGELIRLLAYHALQEETDLDMNIVFGYEDRGAIQIAFEQGEVNTDSATSFTYAENILPKVEAGEVTPISTHGFLDTDTGEIVRDSLYPDLPTMPEVYESVAGNPAEGDLWEAYKSLVLATNNTQGIFWAHGDAPEGAVEAMKAGIASMEEDPEFQTFLDENVGYPIVTGQALDGAFTRIAGIEDSTIAWIKDHLNEVYDERL